MNAPRIIGLMPYVLVGGYLKAGGCMVLEMLAVFLKRRFKVSMSVFK